MTVLDSSTVIGPSSHVHILGIGGAGMSAIARILLESGISVSGSDRQTNEITQALQRDGAIIYQGHEAQNIDQATVLLISSAVKADNPELKAAQAAGLPILNRREAFRYLLPDKVQIAVAGTHGKTTTTALIVHLLRETGHDPSYIVGGVLNSTHNNAHVGKGSAFVVEADEYGGMFLGLSPKIAVITNIEHDHPDIFPTICDVTRTFRQFAKLVSNDGTLIICNDDRLARAVANSVQRSKAYKQIIRYGLHSEADLRAEVAAVEARFTAIFRDKRIPAKLSLAGDHNIQNALAALAAVSAYGVPLEEAIPALATFQGTGRRFEIMGSANGITIISDYGHHPTAIRATLQAARQRYPNSPIWAVWQPHTYSRTKLLVDKFAHAFGDADHVLITDIYAAREKPDPDAPTEDQLAKMMVNAGNKDARHSGSLEPTSVILEREAKPGDVVIIFSAGDAPKVGEMLLQSAKA